MKEIFNNVFYIGAEDKELDLFENQYKLKNGVTYNSYAIIDSKTIVLDSVDSRKNKTWIDNIKLVLNKRNLDYFVISHLEPDHSGSIEDLLKEYPETTIVGTEKMFSMLPQFINEQSIKKSNKLIVKDNDTLLLGNHNFIFYAAPMIHWPEVLTCYESTTKIFFSADAFGTFGIPHKLIANTLEEATGWPDEGRRYYTNIVGKYGIAVQNLIKKLSNLNISTIAPLHGPILTGEINHYINLYNIWSSYSSEKNGTLIVYSTMHGNTKNIALYAQKYLETLNEPTEIFDISRSDVSSVLSKAFIYNKLLLVTVTYDGDNMPCMQDFLFHLKIKNLKNKKIGIIQNGSWGPVAGKITFDYLNNLKELKIIEFIPTVKSKMKESDKTEINKLLTDLIK
ncbi:MAG: FprA family A-type flavoprotein [Treponema sp.]|nr:FprA family A-type flavoprotein [Treponema sp.]